MSTSSMAAHCQHACKVSLCPFNFTVLPYIKFFSPINIDIACKNINVTKACTLSYTVFHGLPF